MPYKLSDSLGDSLAVPQLVFAKLPETEDDWVRVALYILATGETDPACLARALRLKSPERAKEALLYWKGAGLLESCAEAQAESTPQLASRPHLTSPEVTAAAVKDPSIAALVQECQRLMGGVITQADTNILVSLYCNDGMPLDMILLGVAHFSALGKRSARYIERVLLGWQRDGIDSGAAVERYLKQLAQREACEKRVAKLFALDEPKFTKAERALIADWYENFGYDDSMVTEAIAYAGEKKSVRYVGGILRAWYSKGYKTVRDVMRESAGTMQNLQPAASSARNSAVLSGGLKRAPSFLPGGAQPNHPQGDERA